MSKLLIFFSVIFLFPTLVYATSIQKINQLIKENGFNWRASNNRVWNLSSGNKNRLNGVPYLPKSEFTFLPPDQKLSDFPAEIDWRDYQGFNYMTPVKNQDNCGSCVAFASLAVMEAQINIANGWPGLNIDFSEQQLFSCGGGSCNFGWYPNKALNFMKSSGVTDEGCMIYTSGIDGRSRSCSDKCPDYSNRISRIDGYKLVAKTKGVALTMIEALQNGPLVAVMKTFPDLTSYESGVYEHIPDDTEGGGHAIAIVGYNNIAKYWIVKNSWGDDWGEDGYFRIRMGDPSGLEAETYSVRIDSLRGMSNIVKPDRREVISGDYKILLKSSIRDVEKIQLELKGVSVRRMLVDAIPSKDLSGFYVDLKTTELQDGVYDARVITTYKNFNKKLVSDSVVQRFFIQNKNPNMSLVIQKPRARDTLRVRAKLIFELKSKPVPVMKLALLIKDKTGKVIKVNNSNPTEKTNLIWNTLEVENGDYEIWLQGEIGKYKQESKHIKIKVYNWSGPF